MKIEGPNNATLGSLSNDDCDGNEDGKKAITVYKKKNNHAMCTVTLFSTFLSSGTRCTTTRCHVSSRTGTFDDNFLLLFLNVNTVL